MPLTPSLSEALMEDTVLRISNLSVEYITSEERVQAVNGIDLAIREGETLGLVGETGAGKTTTALSIIGLLPVPPARIASGSIEFMGSDILALSEKQMERIRGNDISMIFQDPMSALNPVITVEEQIMEVYLKHEKASREEARKRAHEMLEMVGVPASRGRDYPHQFSGGMKQRVVIAMALACNPRLLIADEPTTALDVTIQAQILDKIRQLKDQFHTSMLMITHDLGIVAEVCDAVSVIYCGRIVEHGSLEDIFEDHRHPYTQGLFDSLPNGATKKVPLKSIGGELPNPADLPEGCSFCPRCPFAMDICRKEKPPVHYFSDSHYSECHLFGGRE